MLIKVPFVKKIEDEAYDIREHRIYKNAVMRLYIRIGTLPIFNKIHGVQFKFRPINHNWCPAVVVQWVIEH